MKRSVGAALALCLASGCGAGGAPAAETPSSAPAMKNGADEPAAEDSEQAPAGGASHYAEPPSSTKEEGKIIDALSLDGALALFKESESQLTTGVLDCGKACKALGSMERSMDRICELTGPEDPEKRCQNAREKAKAARERVEKHCPECS